MAAPVFTHVLVPPSDLPFWEYDGQDGMEFLTRLDNVGDLVLYDTPTSHIARDLIGPWAMYQLLTDHTPPPDTASACAETARALGQDLLAQRITEALPLIEAATDAVGAETLFTQAVLAGDWSTIEESKAVLCDRFALWLRDSLPRKNVESNAAFQDGYRKLWAETQMSHPRVWDAYRQEYGL